MKDKKDKADRLLDELSKELAERARSRERPSLFQDRDDTLIPWKDRLSKLEGGELPRTNEPGERKSRGTTETSSGNLGCSLVLSLAWTAWTIYAAWPVVVSFTDIGYEFIIKFVWILIAWGAPMFLFFSIGTSE